MTLAGLEIICNFALFYGKNIFHINDVNANASLRCIVFSMPYPVAGCDEGATSQTIESE